MDKIEGFFAVMVERPRYDPKVIGIGSYEQAIDTYHEHVEYHAKFNPDYKLRLIKISFLD